jgi:Glycosyl transferase family 2
MSAGNGERNLIRRLLSQALDRRFRSVISRVDGVDGRLSELASELAAARAALQQLGPRLEHFSERTAQELSALRTALDDEVRPMLRTLLEEEAENRRRLFALRASGDYELAFSEPEPLVSITLATHGRPQQLLTRALPSLLEQTYTNLEVIVIGDAESPQLGREIARIGDPRVRYGNLTQRISTHPDAARRWLIGSTMARNEAQRRVQGRWLVHFDDDDHLRCDAIASLLALAREQRVEVAYGGFEMHLPDGQSRQVMTFPPQPGAFAFPTAIVHAGLGFLERELIAAYLNVPGDIYLLTRMLRIGVRFAMLERIVFDYYPSKQWAPPGSLEP